MVASAASYTGRETTQRTPLFLAFELGANTWNLGFTTCQFSNSNFGFARGSGLSIDASRAKVANPSLTKEAEMTSPLSFDDLQSILHQRIDQLPDHRKEGPNTQYRIRDAA